MTARPSLTDILARLDAIGAHVDIKRERYSGGLRAWSCYIAANRGGAHLSAIKTGGSAEEAIGEAWRLFEAASTGGMPLEAMLAGARADLAAVTGADR